MITFDYQGVRDGIIELNNAVKKLEEEVNQYSTIINKIGSSSLWRSIEKDSIVSTANSAYLQFFQNNCKSVQNLVSQVENKASDFEEAENMIKAMSI